MKFSTIKRIVTIALTVGTIGMAIKRNLKQKVEDTKAGRHARKIATA